MNDTERSRKLVLQEMCSIVGAKYDDIDFNELEWYRKYQWTKQQENAFKEWMEFFLYNDSGARRGLMALPKKNKKHIKTFVNFFISVYGWDNK